MGLALDTVAFSVTNPSTTLTAATAVSGDSFTVRNTDVQNPIYLDDIVRLGATAGVLRVRSPRMHDFQQGIRVRSAASNARPQLGNHIEQRLYPADILTVELTGGAAEVDGGALFTYYSNIDGISANLQSWDAIQPRIVNILGNEVSTTTAGTAFVWADTAVNASFDVLKAGAKYALLGYETDTEVAAIALKGPETGNLRAGGPGTVERAYTTNWFVRRSRDTGRPWIPVFSGTNKATTFVSVSHSATGATVIVNLILAELSG